ncbi:hypothetical protein MPH_01163 [Macrophomina phaseolina MS6]|uniref:Uncharacterized protein n=1 Tax=Macrophomina phaseolina (strain MS6) TaxID=1126212 RepID=K2SY66_MACPH|nr:hypothetical protein MPH_01163 [Macrophomina phaseolina MS6]
MLYYPEENKVDDYGATSYPGDALSRSLLLICRTIFFKIPATPIVARHHLVFLFPSPRPSHRSAPSPPCSSTTSLPRLVGSTDGRRSKWASAGVVRASDCLRQRSMAISLRKNQSLIFSDCAEARIDRNDRDHLCNRPEILVSFHQTFCSAVTIPCRLFQFRASTVPQCCLQSSVPDDKRRLLGRLPLTPCPFLAFITE